MTNLLADIDRPFSCQYKGLLGTQQIISHVLESYTFNLNKDEINNAIYERMMAFWYFHVNNCAELGREVKTVAADFFTETCLFFLKPCLKQYGLVIVSEKEIQKEKISSKVIRPDLSIWKGNDLFAVIELKVSDGWKGKTMIEHLDNRKKEIQEIWPDVFFGVISFWNCFGEKGMDKNNPDYIGLYNFKMDYNHKATGNTIDQMVKRIVDTIGASVVVAKNETQAIDL